MRIDADVRCCKESSKYKSAYEKSSSETEAGNRWKRSRIKARLVSCRNFDKNDLDKTFASMVELSVMNILLAIAVQREWCVHQNE